MKRKRDFREDYQDKALWSQSELADFLFMSTATICRMVQTGAIPCIVLRSGKRKKNVRFRKEEIEEWLRSRTHGMGESRGHRRKRGRIGNGVATETGAVLQVSGTES